MTEKITEQVVRVDTRGMVCPYPAFEAAKAISKLAPGEVLEVLTDSDISAKESIPQVARNRNCTCEVQEREGYWSVRLRLISK